MAGFTSFASTAMQALSIANTVVGGINSYRDNSGERDYQQAKQKSALELANLQQKNALDKQALRLSAEETEAKRRDALRRAIAKQRAKFGASGIETGTGSGQAVLLGIFDESEEEKTQREALDAMKTGMLDDSYDRQQRLNTLELTQLKERNKLKKAGSALQALTSIF